LELPLSPVSTAKISVGKKKKIEKRWGIEAAALETVPVNYVRRGERQSY